MACLLVAAAGVSRAERATLARIEARAPQVKRWTGGVLVAVGVWFLLLALFAETFATVQENFAEVAATLFPGGEGRLRLTEPEDEDEQPGIEVELRPAGKRVTRLSLLSGGEKALGAISFLFALFLAKPCPFYLLDEVEAALDDVNLQRLLGVVEEFRTSSQLIIVTHQKRTMEIADALYGISMGGEGVSKVICERLERVEQTATADA